MDLDTKYCKLWYSFRLHFLEAVLMETLRYVSLVPLIEHRALEDTGTSNYCFPIHLLYVSLRGIG